MWITQEIRHMKTIRELQDTSSRIMQNSVIGKERKEREKKIMKIVNMEERIKRNSAY